VELETQAGASPTGQVAKLSITLCVSTRP